MYPITDQHIEYMLRDLDAKGIRTPDLQQNLLDHICILAERNLEEEEDFCAASPAIVVIEPRAIPCLPLRPIDRALHRL
jgi:hypothetical protein